MFSGETLYGPLEGSRLDRLPLFQSTWQEWKSLFPRTLLPDGNKETREGHGSRFTSPEIKFVPGFVEKTRLFVDNRLPETELVLGVSVEGSSRAYPLATLHKIGPVLNDTIGKEDVVIFTLPCSWVSIAFFRSIDGHKLTFKANEQSVISDINTQSCWDITGKATSGKLSGKSLRFAPSGLEKWFAWSAYHPDTEIYQAKG